MQELLGHADVNTTVIYTHVLERDALSVRSRSQSGSFRRDNSVRSWRRGLSPASLVHRACYDPPIQEVGIESLVNWPEGGRSIYFRDPDDHVIELKTSNWHGNESSPGLEQSGL